jgi:multidrug efflux pump subunit AcrA (membrane-fusion protein)
MYATAILHVQRRTQALSIPVEAVAGTTHPTVFVINAGGEVEERPVTLGLETATRFEVLSGLKEGERIMIGNRSLVHVGEKVVPETVRLAAAFP